MNEHEFQSKLAELMGEISTLPASERVKLEKLAVETRQRHGACARPSAAFRRASITCG